MLVILILTLSIVSAAGWEIAWGSPPGPSLEQSNLRLLHSQLLLQHAGFNNGPPDVGWNIQKQEWGIAWGSDLNTTTHTTRIGSTVHSRHFSYTIEIPLWFPLMLAASLLLAAWWPDCRRETTCPVCSYDLSSTPAKCPECGWPEADNRKSRPLHRGPLWRRLRWGTAIAGCLGLTIIAAVSVIALWPLGFGSSTDPFISSPR